MTVRSILLFAPAETVRPDRGPVAYALSMAKFKNASLTVLCVALDVTSPGAEVDAGAKVQEIAAAARNAGVECQVITEHSHAIGLPEVVAEHARMHDLSICGTAHEGLLSEAQIAKALLFSSGRPLMLVPASHDAPYVDGPITAAWDNTAQAARALGDAITLLDVAQVRLLSVGGEKALPTDMNPDGLVAALQRRGVSGDYHHAELAERKIAIALAEEAAAAGAGLLVMGAFAHSLLRQFVLGGATAQVLAEPRMPTLLSH